MAEKTEAEKKAQAKYMKKFRIARVRMTEQEHQRMIEHINGVGASINSFILSAISEKIERDSKG